MGMIIIGDSGLKDLRKVCLKQGGTSVEFQGKFERCIK